MKILLPFDFTENVRNFMQRAGYASFTDPNTSQTSYTRRLSRDYYPRLHAYIEKDQANSQFINLHLDQKKPSYPGAHAHNAEHEGGRVGEEGHRLKGLIKNQMDNQKQTGKGEKDGFWGKLFG